VGQIENYNYDEEQNILNNTWKVYSSVRFTSSGHEDTEYDEVQGNQSGMDERPQLQELGLQLNLLNEFFLRYFVHLLP